MPYADIDAGRLYYEQHGHGEPLVCIQGLAMDVSGWRPQIPVFARHHQVTVFDNRDVGRSFYASAPYDIPALAADALALVDCLGLRRFHLLGSSMGGAIAQELALSHPQRVLSLTLCVTYGGNGRLGRERTRLALAGAEGQTDAEHAAALMALTLSEQTFEEVADQLGAMAEVVVSYPYRQRREGYVRQLAASASHEARDRLPGLRLPVHVIGAEQDAFVPVWKSHELARLIPGARLSIIAGAAHAVNLERSAEYNALVLEFLAHAALQGTPATASGA
ncbi:MAG: 3-oxoadipate enol-lactonase [Solirubrobacteraceae bacterium]|nr:3-oxoadipate enol-lactonase [Solirubrobacteraceae bacterium]